MSAASPTLGEPGLVGREAELLDLRQLASTAETDGLHAVLVSGEAGIGKTKLVEGFLRQLELEQWSTHIGHCIEYSARPLPLGPVVAVLRSVLRQLEDNADSVIGARRDDLALLLPELRSDEDIRANLAGDHDRLLDAIGETLRVAADVRPIAIVIEDIHWADAATLDLVATLARARAQAPILVIATERTGTFAPESDGLGRWATELRRLSNVHTLAVDRFGRDELAEQAEQVLGHAPTLELLDELENRTAGNAYFAYELLLAHQSNADLSVSLRDFVAERLRRLDADRVDLLRCVAIAGGAISHELLRRILPSVDLAPLLRSLIDQAVLDVHEPGYRFRHALMREAIERELLPFEAEALHERVATAMSEHVETSEAPGELANLALHWRSANDPDRSLITSWRAAKAAASVAAFETAADMAEHALDAWDIATDPEDVVEVTREDMLLDAAQWLNSCYRGDEAASRIERALDTWAAALPPGRQALLVAHLIPIKYTLGRPQEVAGLVERARELIGDEESTDAARVHNRIAKQAVAEAMIHAARASSARAIEIAEVHGPEDVLIEATTTMALAAGVTGDPERGRELAREARERALRADRVSLVANAFRTDFLIVEFNEGRSRECLESARRALDFAERHCGPRWRADFRVDLAQGFVESGQLSHAGPLLEQLHTESLDDLRRLTVLQIAGHHAIGTANLGAAREFLVEASGIADRYESAQETGYQLRLLAELYRNEGRLEEALEFIERALELQLPSDNLTYTRESIVEMLRTAALAADAGLVDRDDLVARSRACVESFGGPGHINELYAQLMAFELAMLDGSAVAADAEAMVASLTGTNQLRDLVSVHVAAAELMAAQDEDADPQVIAGHFATAIELAELHGLVGAAERARSLARLAEAEPAAGQQDRPFDLTARELEVLQLVADGLTNKAIGEALFVSPRTVSTHVSNLLSKLGVTTRGEAGALFHRLGLRVRSGD